MGTYFWKTSKPTVIEGFVISMEGEGYYADDTSVHSITIGREDGFGPTLIFENDGKLPIHVEALHVLVSTIMSPEKLDEAIEWFAFFGHLADLRELYERGIERWTAEQEL